MSENTAITETELRAVAERIRLLRQKATEHAIEIGCALLRIKKGLPHGAFVKWVEKECEFKIRTAQDLMKLARDADSYTQPVALLVPSTLRVFVSKNTPETVKQQVTSRLKSGEVTTRRELSLAIRKARTDNVCKEGSLPKADGAPNIAMSTLFTVGAVGDDVEVDRARKIADLLIKRLSAEDYSFVTCEISWGVWNRVLMWLLSAKKHIKPCSVDKNTPELSTSSNSCNAAAQ